MSHCQSYAVDRKVVGSPLCRGLVSVRASNWFLGAAEIPMTWCSVKDCPWRFSGEVTILNILLNRFGFVLAVVLGPTGFVIQKHLCQGAQPSATSTAKGKTNILSSSSYLMSCLLHTTSCASWFFRGGPFIFCFSALRRFCRDSYRWQSEEKVQGAALKVVMSRSVIIQWERLCQSE